MSYSRSALDLACSICPYARDGVDNESLGDILDAWLADEFASDAHRHIHSWSDDAGGVQ